MINTINQIRLIGSGLLGPLFQPTTDLIQQNQIRTASNLRDLFQALDSNQGTLNSLLSNLNLTTENLLESVSKQGQRFSNSLLNSNSNSLSLQNSGPMSIRFLNDISIVKTAEPLEFLSNLRSEFSLSSDLSSQSVNNLAKTNVSYYSNAPSNSNQTGNVFREQRTSKTPPRPIPYKKGEANKGDRKQQSSTSARFKQLLDKGAIYLKRLLNRSN